MNLQESTRRWRTGLLTIVMCPVIGIVLGASESPPWAVVLGVAVMVSLVALGSSLVFWRGTGPVGWTPSSTLPRAERGEH